MSDECIAMTADVEDMVETARPLHAVARLREKRLERSTRPFLARGGPKGERCFGCRLRLSHCLCSVQVEQVTQAGVCLLMHDSEPLKPSNTGWLIADVVRDTYAFGWKRTEVNPELLALLADPQWQPYVVFPGEFVQPPERVVHEVAPPVAPEAVSGTRRPLFVVLDATWSEASKMFRKSPYLDRFPVLSLHPDHVSRYRLRRSHRGDHFCTSEVAAMCLALAGDRHAAQVLSSWLDVFTHHYMRARDQRPPQWDGVEHQQLSASLSAARSASSAD